MAAGTGGAISAAAVGADAVGAEIALAVVYAGDFCAALLANYLIALIHGGEDFKFMAAFRAAIFINRHITRLRNNYSIRAHIPSSSYYTIYFRSYQVRRSIVNLESGFQTII